MRRALALLTLVVTFAAVVTPAYAATSPVQREIKALQAQVKTLQAQVKTLKKNVTNAQSLAVSGLLFGACSTAAITDALGGTWSILDQKLGTTFGPQSAVSDYGTCKSLQITRATGQVPPSFAVLITLMNLFKS
jgi:hypothetical protein